MGDLQHFCLRWNNYQNSITTAFENLRDDEDFIDVTLACDGKTLKAHRVVLSACSPYFRELLKSTPCKHPVIVLQDVVFDDLHALVEFIYHGEVNVHQRNLTSFLKTAEVLKVSGLTQQNAATATTPASSASPSSDHYSENLSHRFTTRSPGTPSEKMNPFQQPFLYNSNHVQIGASANAAATVNDDRNSPRTLSTHQSQVSRHRRHIRSPTPIRYSQSREDSPISLKRAKSADNALQSPLLHCSNASSLSPSTMPNDESSTSAMLRTRKNSCEGLPSSRRGSPNEIANLNNNSSSSSSSSSSCNNNDKDNDDGNAISLSSAAEAANNSISTTSSTTSTTGSAAATTTTITSTTTTTTTTTTTNNVAAAAATTISLSSCTASSSSSSGSVSANIASNTNENHVSYDENHNDEDSAMANLSHDDDDDEPPVDFSTSSSKKLYNRQQNSVFSTSKSSPKNLSLKSEPMDLVYGNNNNNNNADDNENDNNNFNDDDSNQSEDRLSDQSPPPSAPYAQALLEHDDAFQSHRGYLDSKLFAAAGASFSFNMAAAALAADSLAGFNHHQSHSAVAANAVLDGLAASSQGLKKVFPCLACGKVLCSKASLKRHVADKHASHQEEYRCAICERVYCSRNSLMTHIYTYHKTRPTLLIPPPHHTSTPTSHATDIKF